MKSLPIEDLQKREFLEEYGIFRKEKLLYEHLAPKLKKYSGEMQCNEFLIPLKVCFN